jgi:hypothetical protein
MKKIQNIFGKKYLCHNKTTTKQIIIWEFFVKIIKIALILGLVSLSSMTFAAELVLQNHQGQIAKIICSGDKSDEIVDDAKIQISNREVDGFIFSETGKLILILKDGSVVSVKQDETGAICFIGQ